VVPTRYSFELVLLSVLPKPNVVGVNDCLAEGAEAIDARVELSEPPHKSLEALLLTRAGVWG
jgi:hypothetical protein